MNYVKKIIFASITLLSIIPNFSIASAAKQRELEIAKLENDQYPLKKIITIEVPDCVEDVYLFLNYSTQNMRGPVAPRVSQRFLITPTNKTVSIELLPGFADQAYLELIPKTIVEKQLAHLKSQPKGVTMNPSIETKQQQEKEQNDFRHAKHQVATMILDELSNGEAITLPYPFKKTPDTPEIFTKELEPTPHQSYIPLPQGPAPIMNP